MEKFIGDDMTPILATCDTSRMAGGEPCLPTEFVWRGRVVRVVALIRSWHETGPCSHGSSDRYVRTHWYEVATEEDGTLKIYFERQPRKGRKGSRWRVFSRIEED